MHSRSAERQASAAHERQAAVAHQAQAARGSMRTIMGDMLVREAVLK